MDTKSLVLFIVPVFFLPIVIDMIIRAVRKSTQYRANDLTTNLSLGMISTLAGLIVTLATFWIYIYIYEEYAIYAFSLENIAVWICAFLFYDFLYYCAHRAHHRIAMFWAVHIVHHSGEDMNFGLAIRQSAFSEATLWIFFLPMAVLGIPPEIYLAVAMFQLIYQYSIHNTYVGELGWLEKILITPSQHRVHHARNLQYIDKNYGNVLVIWDKMFKTYQREMPDDPVEYGLRSSVKSWSPVSVNFQFINQLSTKMKLCKGLGDKIRALVMEPSWLPAYSIGIDQSASDEATPEAEFKKYNPSISKPALRYSLFQFLTMFLAFISFLWVGNEFQPSHFSMFLGLMVITSITIGGFLDGTTWAWRAEFSRLILLILIGAILFALFSTTVLSILIALYSISCMLYLSLCRQHF